MEQKFKQANAFSMLGEALASGITKIADITVDAYDNVKVAFDTPEVKRMKVVACFICQNGCVRRCDTNDYNSKDNVSS